MTNPALTTPRRGGLLSIFRPAPPAAVIATDPQEIAAKYSHWQLRVLIFATLGYATFYLVRKNYSVVQPLIGAELGINTSGFAWTVPSLIRVATNQPRTIGVDLKYKF